MRDFGSAEQGKRGFILLIHANPKITPLLSSVNQSNMGNESLKMIITT